MWAAFAIRIEYAFFSGRIRGLRWYLGRYQEAPLCEIHRCTTLNRHRAPKEALLPRLSTRPARKQIVFGTSTRIEKERKEKKKRKEKKERGAHAGPIYTAHGPPIQRRRFVSEARPTDRISLPRLLSLPAGRRLDSPPPVTHSCGKTDGAEPPGTREPWLLSKRDEAQPTKSRVSKWGAGDA
ncbi:hypothetical protein LY76DRAFT_688590 [Colletotrichum caudatum]|nr:hypothetical protein LY76DRAFT_688590 [Colletotrichum caudatum]